MKKDNCQVEQEVKFSKPLTRKQAKLMKELTENTDQPIGKLMIKAGYSPASATKPRQVLEAKPFKDIFSTVISDKLILNAHKKLLKAKVRVRTYKKGDLTTEYISEDTLGISKGVELAYKVKGAFAPIETKHTITGLEAKSDEELAELLAEEERAIKRAEQFKAKPIEGEVVEK